MATWHDPNWSEDKAERYDMMARQLSALMEGERDPIANLANASALAYQALENVNWAGCYLLKGETLVLGPFQGKPACVRIPVGRGVCGTAARERRTVRVMDVHAFPGHIACDADSRSELVIPLLAGERLLGVLDFDSPVEGRFDEADERGLERIARLLEDGCEW